MIPDRVAVVDWSAAARPRQGSDSIWIARADATGIALSNPATRAQAESALAALIDAALATGTTLLIGLDFAFGHPAGFARALTGRPGAPAVWEWLNTHLTDRADNTNDRFALAARMNAALPGHGPFWFHPTGMDLPGLPLKGTARHGHGLPDRRICDARVPGTQSVWKLGGAGAVGSQALTGQPLLHRLRNRHPGRIAVWPFDPPDAPVVLAEVFPSLLAPQVNAALAANPGQIRDAVQVRLLATALHHLGGLGPLWPTDAPPETLADEGWILGLGHQPRLAAALSPGG